MHCTPANAVPHAVNALHVPLHRVSASNGEAAVIPNPCASSQVRDIEFASTCEETLLPFHGRCHVAYVPASGVVLGLSKFARLTTLCARRLQSQQGLANEIIDALQVITSDVSLFPRNHGDAKLPADRVSIGEAAT